MCSYQIYGFTSNRPYFLYCFWCQLWNPLFFQQPNMMKMLNNIALDSVQEKFRFKIDRNSKLWLLIWYFITRYPSTLLMKSLIIIVEHRLHHCKISLQVTEQPPASTLLQGIPPNEIAQNDWTISLHLTDDIPPNPSCWTISTLLPTLLMISLHMIKHIPHYWWYLLILLQGIPPH